MDALNALIQFLTDLFAALAAFLGSNSSFGNILGGLGSIKDVIGGDDAANDAGANG